MTDKKKKDEEKNPYEDAICNHPDKNNPNHVHTQACVETGLTKSTTGPVGGLEHIGVPMTPEIAIRERDHAVSMAAEVLNQRAAELRMNRPIDPNSRASSQEERDLVYAESRLIKAGLAIRFDLTTKAGLRCDASPNQIWEFEKAKEQYRSCLQKAQDAKAIEGQ